MGEREELLRKRSALISKTLEEAQRMEEVALELRQLVFDLGCDLLTLEEFEAGRMRSLFKMNQPARAEAIV